MYGNLLTLPVGGGLLYVEPLYVQAQGVQFPRLQFVLVAFGNRVAFAPNLSDALDSLFGEGAGSQAPGTGGSTTTPTPTPSGTARPSAAPTSPPAPGPTGGTLSPQLSAALTRLSAAYADLQAAFRSGDVTRIGEAQTEVNRAAAAVAAARGG